jgi:2'-5' RNA ligase
VRLVPRTALIVEVPEAEPLVREWRLRYDNASLGVPAHVTLLFPFVAVEHFDDVLLDELRRLFAGEAPFSFSLARVARFPEHAWLAPEPAEPFKRLTALIHERYPDYPPYEGIHAEVIPHLTVAEADRSVQDEVDTALTPHLPIAARAEQVALLVEDAAGLWRVSERFALGDAGRRSA